MTNQNRHIKTAFTLIVDIHGEIDTEYPMPWLNEDIEETAEDIEDLLNEDFLDSHYKATVRLVSKNIEESTNE